MSGINLVITYQWLWGLKSDQLTRHFDTRRVQGHVILVPDNCWSRPLPLGDLRLGFVSRNLFQRCVKAFLGFVAFEGTSGFLKFIELLRFGLCLHVDFQALCHGNVST